MTPNQTNPTQDARLTRVELSVQRIEDRIDQLIQEFAEYKAHIEVMIEDHQIALYGDKGRPGLVGQVGTFEKLHIALKGYGREPGLIAEIQDLRARIEKWDDERKWLTRLFIGAIITDMIMRFMQALHLKWLAR